MQTQQIEPELRPAFARAREYIFQVREILISEFADGEKVGLIQRLPLPKTDITNVRVIHLLANNLSYDSMIYTRSQARLFEQDFDPVFVSVLRDIQTVIDDFENLIWYNYEHYFEAGYAHLPPGAPAMEERSIISKSEHEELVPDTKIMAAAKLWRRQLPDTITEDDGQTVFKFWYVNVHRRITDRNYVILDEKIGNFTDKYEAAGKRGELKPLKKEAAK